MDIAILVLISLNLVISAVALYLAWLNDKRWRVAGMMAKLARSLAGQGGHYAIYSAEELESEIDH